MSAFIHKTGPEKKSPIWCNLNFRKLVCVDIFFILKYVYILFNCFVIVLDHKVSCLDVMMLLLKVGRT